MAMTTVSGKHLFMSLIYLSVCCTQCTWVLALLVQYVVYCTCILWSYPCACMLYSHCWNIHFWRNCHISTPRTCPCFFFIWGGESFVGKTSVPLMSVITIILVLKGGLRCHLIMPTRSSRAKVYIPSSVCLVCLYMWMKALSTCACRLLYPAVTWQLIAHKCTLTCCRACILAAIIGYYSVLPSIHFKWMYSSAMHTHNFLSTFWEIIQQLIMAAQCLLQWPSVLWSCSHSLFFWHCLGIVHT